MKKLNKKIIDSVYINVLKNGFTPKITNGSVYIAKRHGRYIRWWKWDRKENGWTDRHL